MSLFSPRTSSQLLIAAACCIMQGCTVSVPEGKFRCDELTSCPDGLQCRSGFCYRKSSASDQGLIAKDMSTEGGPGMRDAGAPQGGTGGQGGAVANDRNGEEDSGGAIEGASGGVGGASGVGGRGSDAGPMATSECVLGEATLGACVLP